MTRWLLVTDTHLGVRADNPTFVKIQQQFCESVLFPTIDAHPEITRVVHLGDVSDHRKYTNFVTLSQWRQFFFRPLMLRYQHRQLQTTFLVGNHDMPYRESMSVTAVRQLVPKHPAFEIISSPGVHTWDGRDVLCLPWMCEENRQERLRLIQSKPARVVFGHLELTGFEMFPGVFQTEGMDPVTFGDYDLVCSGHYHHASSRGNICYLGAPYEMTWHDYATTKGCYLFDPDTIKLELVQNPHRAFFKFRYDDEKRTDAEMLKEVDEIGPATTGRFVKLGVVSKTNPVLYDAIYDRLQSFDPAKLETVLVTPQTTEREAESLDVPSVDMLTTIDAAVESRIPETTWHVPVKAELRRLYKMALERDHG